MESQRRIDLLQHADPAVVPLVTALMDELSRPLSTREIDAELAPFYTRKKRREIIKAIKFLQPIVLLAPTEPKAPRADWRYHGHGTAPPIANGKGSGSITGRPQTFCPK